MRPVISYLETFPLISVKRLAYDYWLYSYSLHDGRALYSELRDRVFVIFKYLKDLYAYIPNDVPVR